MLDGTASPRARVSRLSGLASVSFRMAGKVARRNSQREETTMSPLRARMIEVTHEPGRD